MQTKSDSKNVRQKNKSKDLPETDSEIRFNFGSSSVSF